MASKEFELVIFGASSFVGKILCNYLVNEYTEPNLSWAIAGRSAARLSQLKESLGPLAESIPVVIADAAELGSLQSLCARAEVVISTVGPYALYGELLVKACASSGTDYCDLTGEPQWIKRMIDLYEADARKSGARIVNCCGFDSIPSDLGVKFLQDNAQRQFETYCDRVKMRVKTMQGGVSGGTIASGVNLYKEAAKSPEIRQQLQDPYSICPTGHEFTEEQHEVGAEFDPDFNAWVGPFVMASINTRVVFRSNALLEDCYAASFRYEEAMLTGAGSKGEKKARSLSRVTRLGEVAMSVAPIRWLSERFFLPKPGTGPSPEQQKNGCYDLRFHGRTPNNDEICLKVTGDMDPGYGSTAKMLAQAAISLRRDVDKRQLAGGFWTPATAFGDDLVERLQSHAGLSFELLSVNGAAAAEEISDTPV